MTELRNGDARRVLVLAAAAGLVAGLVGCDDKAKSDANASASAATMGKDPNCCVGKNDCKGKGGCASKEHGHQCAGKNECKGKGGCSHRDCK